MCTVGLIRSVEILKKQCGFEKEVKLPKKSGVVLEIQLNYPKVMKKMIDTVIIYKNLTTKYKPVKHPLV